MQNIRNFDWMMLAIVLLLTAIGVAFIWSATYRLTPEGPVGTTFWQKQIKWLAVALAAFILVLWVDYLKFARWAYLLYGLGLAALLYVMLFGRVVSGSRRWVTLMGYQAQPSEFVKIAIVFALARYLMYRRNYRTLRGLVWPFLLALAPMGLILKQPDLGTAMMLLPVLFVMLYVAGAQPKHLLGVACAGIAAAPIFWFFAMTPMQKGRILSFINPGSDPLGRSYQVTQSLIAIASGGITGKGFARGEQNMLNLLPARHTDFIFSVIVEEWGALGGVLVLALFLLFFIRGMDIAARTREPFGRLIAVGGLAMLAFQLFVNVGMTMRLCPVTGLTLPFVSYGGSSLLTSFIVLGMIMNVGMRRKAVVAPEDFA